MGEVRFAITLNRDDGLPRRGYHAQTREARLERMLCSPCPCCEGAGYVKSTQTVVGEILQKAQKIAGTLETGEVTATAR